MHFVICMFTSLVIFAVSVLFAEIFPKWFKGLLVLGGSYTTGYAIMILIRKISEMSKAYKEPWLFPGVWIASGISLAVIIVVKLYLHKTEDKRIAKREERRAKNLEKWAKQDEEMAIKEKEEEAKAEAKAQEKAKKKAEKKLAKEAKKKAK